ncbi:unnamed protein product [Rotaria magnacalcarata]|uniref:G-protein coupled receptors family 1 profile domain-containing protein n=2 Tax=Rotaria magnacalcarata TaxID=392030 RepID=A0A819ZQH0_9BILA|nr:unnamed protein product [Rotaria magnacalcarata]CAF2146950.1 unnamed protein product [Rotaria magnacalcarata]CAF4176016.1 unnamed protein product [Rotaria magnacalcarata]
MTSLPYIGQQFTLYVGLYFLITGLTGSIMLIFIFISVFSYRRTPCTFYFIIATVHDCGQLIARLAPYVVSAYLNIDITRISASWCKLRFFFATSLGAIPLTCACLATIDQFLVTSQNVRFRQWSSIKIAYRVCSFFIIIWWLHGALWLYYQNISPITGTCVYLNSNFHVYAIIFVFSMLCFIHIIIMATFACLAYRNIHKTATLSRQNVDRQMTMMVCIQVFLIVIGLSPYGIDIAHIFATSNIQKSDDRKAKEAWAATITYILCFLAYGVCTGVFSVKRDFESL